MNPLWLIVPVVIGLAHPVIIQMCVRVSRATGDMESAVILHVIGTIVGVGWLGLGLRGGGFSGWAQIPGDPKRTGCIGTRSVNC